MGTCFNSAHMRTLVKLNELAQKHNCVINFGFDDIFEDSFDFDRWCEENHVPDNVREEVEDCMEFKEQRTWGAKYWFELIDKSNPEHYKHHIFAYDEIESLCFYNDKDIDNMTEEAQDWFNYNIETCYPLSVRIQDVRVDGFKGIDTSEAYRCYRSGMCLKYFGDLVCDYLHEERIVETY